MSQSVIKASKELLKKMEEYYKGQLKSNPPVHTLFAAKVNGCSITAYKSGKVLFQGKSHEAEAMKWGHSPDKNQDSRNQSYATSPSFVNQSHIGSDEAGSGDFFGPLTAAAAFVAESKIPLLKELGVKDSKAMSDDKIQEIARQIKSAEIPYSLMVLHNEKYNRLQQKGWTQGKMKAMLHYHAIMKVKERIGSNSLDGILVDQFCQPSVFERHLKSEQKRMPDNIHFITKAESHSIAVAAASIMARAKFVKEMDRLSDEAGFQIQKGASKKVDEQAARIIQSQGKQALDQYSKVHFSNYQKAEQILRLKNRQRNRN
ncbi:ribonuclease HIII [Virgibacillus sp. MSP4-1]|uniref:ribonuclease HIII n=1 Tax=Virgibacillus sp. MSP4-1 TaxID=2700081 RepID=UPI0003A5E166|nr:ribonuclease HIII [Virgibacillus sp. MSP4-1]QHS22961.1 ribonuclease HIII [Virgibacillus sp. MSP4-1]